MSIKSRIGESNHDDHDEGYFVSFTDLLVGILFIFIIMLMISATSYQDQKKKTDDVTKVMTQINDARDKVLVEIERSLKDLGVPVSIDKENGVLRLPESILFESGKSELNENGNEALNKLADVLLTYLPCLSKTDDTLKAVCKNIDLIREPMLDTVLVEGHTDNKPFRTETGMDSNWGLSAQRSITVFKKLTAYRPALDKEIKNTNDIPILGVSAYEARRPISLTELDKNRRIDLRFIMKSPTPKDIERIQKEIQLR